MVFLQEVLSAVPVRCLESTTALSIEVEPCNRKTTCQLVCKDGTKYYYDLKNIPGSKTNTLNTVSQKIQQNGKLQPSNVTLLCTPSIHSNLQLKVNSQVK
jgi:hypothetical protein